MWRRWPAKIALVGALWLFTREGDGGGVAIVPALPQARVRKGVAARVRLAPWGSEQ
jgi:hypothetical protein